MIALHATLYRHVFNIVQMAQYTVWLILRITMHIIAERISARHWIADSGPGLAASVACMYVRHAFGMQLIFWVKIVYVFGKDR